MQYTLFFVYNIFGWFSYALIFILGLILGSFLNSWMWRMRENIRTFLTHSRSMCVHCHRQLLWIENVPLFSYIFLKGKCRTCHKKIPVHYFLVELFTAIVLTFIAWYHVNYLSAFNLSAWLRDVFFITILIVVFAYDAMYQEINTGLVWVGAVVGFFINWFYLGYSAQSLLLGALIAGGFFALQYIISKGKWIGGGDVRLGVMMGVWLGWPNVLVALFFAYLIGAVIGVVLLLTKKVQKGAAIPFGTFLAVGTFFAIYHGNEIIQWYLSLTKF